MERVHVADKTGRCCAHCGAPLVLPGSAHRYRRGQRVAIWGAEAEDAGGSRATQQHRRVTCARAARRAG